MFRRTAGTDDTGRVNSLPSYTSTPENVHQGQQADRDFSAVRSQRC